ncbi:MAG: penicillin-binding transpeptidase domain-containing protein [Pygmaiobacter sp.]|nr:penicillin-binding transpeptidase domain-containing protein [Pygmaiobacter sp.]
MANPNTSAPQNKPNQAASSAMRRKILAMAALLVVIGFGSVVYSLVDLQIVHYEDYKVKAENQQLKDTIIPANRGIIYDADMKVLAQSATVWNVAVAPSDIDEEYRAGIAAGLAPILDIDEQTILDKLNKTESAYQSIKLKVDKPVADAVRQFALEGNGGKGYPGISLSQDSKRYYPYGNFAASVLGFTGRDNNGLAGLESQYDDVLAGTPGRQLLAQTATGKDMGYDSDSYYAPKDGDSLVLTIDEVIQHYAEKELERAVKDYNVIGRGVVIVMDVKTGGILAMATKGDFDPNDPFTIYDEAARAAADAVQDDPATTDVDEHKEALSNAQYTQWRNKAVSDLYEPGSVFKIVTASAALDSGSSTLNDSFNCTGSIEVSGVIMHCAKLTGHGKESFSQALVNSCNPAFIQIGTKMGAETFFNYFNAFGMTQKTGIDLPGEAQSQFYTADTLGPVQLASSSFGQSNKVTPIQMITAVATAANGGNLVQPHLVSKILDADGNLVKDMEPEIKRQVISKETSSTICSILQDSVGRAAVKGYRVGGKSGTSQKLDSDNPDALISSFVGIAPCDDPQVAVLVILDEPQNKVDGELFGGYLAAPVVGQIMSQALPYLGVEKVYTAEEAAEADATVPNVVGNEVANAQVILTRDKGFNVDVRGNGGTVVRQSPTGGTLPRGSTVVLYTDASIADQVVTVPDLSGRDVTAVQKTLIALGLNLRKDGNPELARAVATTQDIAAGTEVPVGSVVTVSFHDPNIPAD